MTKQTVKAFIDLFDISSKEEVSEAAKRHGLKIVDNEDGYLLITVKGEHHLIDSFSNPRVKGYRLYPKLSARGVSL